MVLSQPILWWEPVSGVPFWSEGFWAWKSSCSLALAFALASCGRLCPLTLLSGQIQHTLARPLGHILLLLLGSNRTRGLCLKPFCRRFQDRAARLVKVHLNPLPAGRKVRHMPCKTSGVFWYLTAEAYRHDLGTLSLTAFKPL